jgi:hypothetical protein
MLQNQLSEEYKASMRLWEQEKKVFKEQHPRYCYNCDGWGYFWILKKDIKFCSECVERMICPLCAEPLDIREWPPYGKVCTDPDCGWDEHGSRDGSPDQPDKYV